MSHALTESVGEVICLVLGVFWKRKLRLTRMASLLKKKSQVGFSSPLPTFHLHRRELTNSAKLSSLQQLWQVHIIAPELSGAADALSIVVSHCLQLSRETARWRM